MPIPFHRLHCDLQYRLRDLVTPSELYQLQIALGDIHNCLGTPQRCIRTAKVCELFQHWSLCPWNWLNDEFGTQKDQKQSDLTYYLNRIYPYDTDMVIIIENLQVNFSHLRSDSSFPNLIHSHAILNIKNLEIDSHIQLDPLQMTSLASLCSKECHSLTTMAMDLKPDVNMQLLFTLFPNLKKLHLYVLKIEKWSKYLSDSKVTELESLCIEVHPGYEDYTVNFCNINSLYRFCKDRITFSFNNRF
uniref:F-box domain-containing protein n=1 Tax=Panagrellus redivivus TaxID=6233 RepID=A0A7E4UPW5_PANRE